MRHVKVIVQSCKRDDKREEWKEFQWERCEINQEEQSKQQRFWQRWEFNVDNNLKNMFEFLFNIVEWSHHT